MKVDKKEYNHAFDFLRAVSIIGVVIMHSSAYALTVDNVTLASYSWLIYSFMYNSFYWAVPIFFMISGALLLSYEGTNSNFFQKRMKRIGLPLVFWSIFYLAIYCTRNECSFEYIIHAFITGKPFYHMWFLFCIAGLYLITPIVKNVYDNISEKEKKKFWIIFVFWISFAELSRTYVLHDDAYSIFEIFIYYLPYYLIGYEISKIKITNISPLFYILTGSLLTVILINMSLNVIFEKNHMLLIHTNYLNPVNFICAVSLFLVVNHYRNRMFFKNKMIKEISIASFGIYLIHPIFITLINKIIAVDFINNLPLVTMSIYAILVILISYVTVKIVKRIPFFKYIF